MTRAVIQTTVAWILWLSSQSNLMAEKPALELVQTIPLKGPAGRLDHLALDKEHGRLFVANMANSSLDVVDLKAAKLVKQIPGQHKIQGVAYAPDLDRIFIGNGQDGVCNVFDGKSYDLIKGIRLDDADNVRFDPSKNRVYVTHAEKRLAVIDARSLEILTDIKLPGAPEAFQLETGRPRLYLNVPRPSQVVVVDTAKLEVVSHYPLRRAGSNFPLAIDEANHRILVGCRDKPMVVVLDSETGKEVAALSIPGDADDLFYDAKRKRVYVTCGAGILATISQIDADHHELLEKILTTKLARTCLWDSTSSGLYVVLPRHADQDGPEIRMYRPRP
jgi:DNA-binding beta-propeller fold protein YncE